MVKGDVETDNDFDRIRKMTRLVNDIAAQPSRAKTVKKNPAEKKVVAERVEAVRNLLDKAGLEDLLELERA